MTNDVNLYSSDTWKIKQLLTPGLFCNFTIQYPRLVQNFVFTGRNEVVAKVMFLHVSVILYTGGGLRRTPPDQGDTTTPPAERTPPDQREPPRTKETPPGPRRTPPAGRPPSPPAYGQWAASTHPTGMHSSSVLLFLTSFCGRHWV